MMDCVAIGDQVAAALAIPLQCEVRAANNLTSSRVVDLASGIYHRYCIISAGANDPLTDKTLQNLTDIRGVSQCKYYVWIAPVDATRSWLVQEASMPHFDYIVTITPGTVNYNALANTILQLTGN